jgi:hypothetical protein
MYRLACFAVCIYFAIAVGSCFAQGTADTADASTSCTFADGLELSVRYTPEAKDQNMNGVWGPAGAPMYLFTQTATIVNNQTIPPGAYSVYLTGKRNNWVLIVNKGVAAGAAYDSKQDLVRAPMDSGKLNTSERKLKVNFVHSEPKACNLRVYYQDSGHWAEFKEQ